MIPPAIGLCTWTSPAQRPITGPCFFHAGRWYRLTAIRMRRWLAAGARMDAGNSLEYVPLYLGKGPGEPFN